MEVLSIFKRPLSKTVAAKKTAFLILTATFHFIQHKNSPWVPKYQTTTVRQFLFEEDQQEMQCEKAKYHFNKAFHCPQDTLSHSHFSCVWGAQIQVQWSSYLALRSPFREDWRSKKSQMELFHLTSARSALRLSASGGSCFLNIVLNNLV